MENTKNEKQCAIHDVELNPHTRVAFDKST